MVNRVAAESHLPLEDSKHERLVLRDCQRKEAEVKWIKWPRVIMDESLSFQSLGLRLNPTDTESGLVLVVFGWRAVYVR